MSATPELWRLGCGLDFQRRPEDREEGRRFTPAKPVYLVSRRNRPPTITTEEGQQFSYRLRSVWRGFGPMMTSITRRGVCGNEVVLSRPYLYVDVIGERETASLGRDIG